MTEEEKRRALIEQIKAKKAQQDDEQKRLRLASEIKSRIKMRARKERIDAAQNQPQAQQEAETNFIPDSASELVRGVVGGAEAAGTVLQNTLVDAVGGLGALGAYLDPTLSANEKIKVSNQNLQAVRDLLAYDPRTPEAKAALESFGKVLAPVTEPLGKAKSAIGESVMDATGDPYLAGLASSAPEMALELIGAGTGRTVGSNIKTDWTQKAEAAERNLAIQKGREESAFDEQGFEPVIDEPVIINRPDILNNVKEVAKKIVDGDLEDVAQLIDADPNFYRAVEQLGINVEPLAAYASKNPQFRSLSGALEVVPASALSPEASRFIEATGFAADRLIRDYGGTIDKAELDANFKTQAREEVDNLAAHTETVYKGLNDILDKKTRVEAPNTRSFLETAEAELGGELPPNLKSILSTLSKTDADGNPIPPTLGYIDFKRKEIGQAIQKRSGEFKDAEVGVLKKLYSTLTSDVDLVAQSAGGDALLLSNAGKELTKMRKQLEDNLVTLYGKDLNQSMSFNVGGAVKNLSKGQVDKFTEVINAIPESQRGQIVLSSLNEVFKGTGKNQGALGVTSFTKWYQTLSRSPKAKKALFDALPKDSRKAVDALFEVSRGVSRALESKIATGISRELFNDNSNFVRKMVGQVATGAANYATGGGITGGVTNTAMTEFLQQSTDQSKRVASLMAEPIFTQTIRQLAKESGTGAFRPSQKLRDLELQLMQTQKYKKWAEKMPEKQMLAGGFIPYLLMQENEQTEQEK